MSSTNKTSLGLNQWVLSDQPVMNDFNSDNAILNAAIAALQQPIGTARIADGAVTTPKIANNSVTAPKIADGAIDTSKLMDDAVTSQKIGIHAVGTAEIADYAITTSKVLTRAITAEKLAAGYISTDYDGDLNELKTPGMYKVVPGISNQHRPPNVIYSSVLVMDAGSSVIIQLAAPASNDRLYIRGVVGGTTSQWTDWVEISALADGSITTAKLADGAVTAEKLADDVIPTASTSRAGIVQLNNTLTSTSTTQALTAAQGKALKDMIDGISDGGGGGNSGLPFYSQYNFNIDEVTEDCIRVVGGKTTGTKPPCNNYALVTTFTPLSPSGWSDGGYMLQMAQSDNGKLYTRYNYSTPPNWSAWQTGSN